MYSNLAKLRKERGITQKKMGELIGLSASSDSSDSAQSNYNRRERGKTPFKSTEMEIIQKFFDKPLGEIFLKYDSN